jgi:hypothetical protein
MFGNKCGRAINGCGDSAEQHSSNAGSKDHLSQQLQLRGGQTSALIHQSHANSYRILHTYMAAQAPPRPSRYGNESALLCEGILDVSTTRTRVTHVSMCNLRTAAGRLDLTPT